MSKIKNTSYKNPVLIKVVTRCLVCHNNVSSCLKCTYACCDQAKKVHCVCLYSYKCDIHTKNLAVCIGSHS